MESGIGYITCNAECNVCNHKWVAVVEVEWINITGEVEYKKPENLECPNCNYMQSDYEVIERQS